ncbi:hypothetical protein [Helicobacter rodentium]|uniref:hypothetical protein n=1 Tax=Helicobacter rodentium TaxID=59617 RepID=UPI00146FB89B|nr:hypothetical protein [Helicobacter rodentium]
MTNPPPCHCERHSLVAIHNKTLQWNRQLKGEFSLRVASTYKASQRRITKLS